MTIQKSQFNLNQSLSGLERLLHKRIGGATNFRGVHYQLLYCCWIMLEKFKVDEPGDFIRHEGIEDVDFASPHLNTANLYIQLKSSINKMDAGTFWTIGVLQNFAEVYKQAKDSRFKLVYNMPIADGNLAALIQYHLTEKQSEFWQEKLASLGVFDYDDFISKISFEQHSASDLFNKIQKQLIEDWNVNIGTEIQFFRSLFFNLLEWSKARATVSRIDLVKLFQDIRDSYSRAPINEAVRYQWINAVDFNRGHRAIVGLRFQKEYFETFNAYLEGDGEVEPPSSSPLPISIDETILRYYPELTVPEVDQTMVWKEKLIRALYAIWKLSEVRRRLNPNSAIEKGWLEKMETQYLAEIEESMIGITNVKPITSKFIEQAMHSKNGMASEDIVKQLFILVND